MLEKQIESLKSELKGLSETKDLGVSQRLQDFCSRHEKQNQKLQQKLKKFQQKQKFIHYQFEDDFGEGLDKLKSL